MIKSSMPVESISRQALMVLLCIEIKLVLFSLQIFSGSHSILIFKALAEVSYTTETGQIRNFSQRILSFVDEFHTYLHFDFPDIFIDGHLSQSFNLSVESRMTHAHFIGNKCYIHFSMLRFSSMMAVTLSKNS